MPSRNVTASNGPPDMERTTTASGRRSANPSICNPPEFSVAIPHRCRRMGAVPKPRAANAEATSRACQSMRSTTRPMVGVATCPVLPKRSGERGIEQVQINFSGLEALAGLQRRDDNLCGAEEHRIDRVEVAVDRLENFRERTPIVARRSARKLVGQRAGLAR